MTTTTILISDISLKSIYSPKAKKDKEQDVHNKVALVQRQPKAPFWKQTEEEPPKEKQMSEAEIQLKNMLQKQLETKITLER